MKAVPNGLIVEGIVTAGKTTLIREIKGVLAERGPACAGLFLSEHYTERVLEDRKAQKTLTVGEVIEHSGSILGVIERLAHLKSSSKFETETGNASIYAVLESFIGSQFANLSTLGIWSPVPSDDRRICELYMVLADLGFSVVILTIAEDRIADAICRTRQHRNDKRAAYLDSIGDPEEVSRHYRDWQRHLLAFYRSLESVCPISVVEIVPSKDNPRYRQLAETWVR